MSGNDVGPGSPWGRPGNGSPDGHGTPDDRGGDEGRQWDAREQHDAGGQSPHAPGDGVASPWGAPAPEWSDGPASEPTQPGWDAEQTTDRDSLPQWDQQRDWDAEQTTDRDSLPQWDQASWQHDHPASDHDPQGFVGAPPPSDDSRLSDDDPRFVGAPPEAHDASGVATPHPTFESPQQGQTTQFAPSRLGPEGSRPRTSTPWYRRRGLVIGGIIGVVVLLLAVIGIPLGIHLTNVAKGDRLASEFTQALDAHNAAWTQDQIDVLASVGVSDALQENADFYSQNNAAMTDLQARCENVAAAQSSLQTLAAAPVPTLGVEAGADASGVYQQAKQQSDGLADRRAAVDTLSTEGVASLAALSDFCAVFPEYNSIINAFGVAAINVYAPTLSIPNGGTIDYGNNLVATCSSTGGCPNYADQAARTAYGDAIDTTFTAFYQDFAAQNTERCFLPEFADVCATYAAQYQTVADNYHAAAEAFRTEQPVLTVGQLPMPTATAAWNAANESVATADNAVNSTWQSLDPETAGDTGAGWQARSLKRALAAHEATITDAVAQLG